MGSSEEHPWNWKNMKSEISCWRGFVKMSASPTQKAISESTFSIANLDIIIHMFEALHRMTLLLTGNDELCIIGDKSTTPRTYQLSVSRKTLVIHSLFYYRGRAAVLILLTCQNDDCRSLLCDIHLWWGVHCPAIVYDISCGRPTSMGHAGETEWAGYPVISVETPEPRSVTIL